MKKKKIFIFSVIFLILFFASPYFLDYVQEKGALSATGGFPCTEGFVSPMVTQCQTSCYPAASCCTGPGVCTMATPSACLESNVTGASAGGQSCGANYLLTVAQASIVNGSQNLILAGTTMNQLTVVATEKGCLGCTAMINHPNVYAFKSKVKSVIDFIIAGNKD